MKVFFAGIFTETNTFAPVPTGMAAFEEMGLRRGDGSGSCPAFEPARGVLEDLAAQEGHSIVPGLMAIAQPNGIVPRRVYEALRDELLVGLEHREPVDAVVLLLHGAMVADGYPDCEGDLLAGVRAIVGDRVPIGVLLDLHCHCTRRMMATADVLVAYKEYPHTDALDRLREVWRLTIATARGEVRPVTAVVDCHANGLWHTQQPRVRAFVDRMQRMEREPGLLSISFGHGFPWGDVPEAGAKAWAISDGDPALAERTAARIADEVRLLRDEGRPARESLDEVLAILASNMTGGPVVIADAADNPGGGAAGDSTFVLQAFLDAGVDRFALGPLWDPMAVRVCMEAGDGATLPLRIGGKTGPFSGDPVDVDATVRALAPDHAQTNLNGALQSCGACACVAIGNEIELVLVSLRQQALGTDLFAGLGIDLAAKRAVAVKSQQHFHAAFAPFASRVMYVDTPGLLCGNLQNIRYKHRPVRPVMSDS